MKTAKGSAISAVFGALPITPLAIAIVLPALLNLIGLGSTPLAALVTLAAVAWLVIWGLRNGKNWVRMLRLAIAGTPASLLPAAARMVETWPALVDVCGWVPRTALGTEPGWAAKILAIVTGNPTALGPQIVRVEDAPAGPVAVVSLTPRITAEHIAAQTSRIADVWGAQTVEVVRSRPNEVKILARVRDPLAGTRTFEGAGLTPPPPPPVTAEDFLSGGDGGD